VHYGIPGMKWGKRSARTATKSPPNYSQDHKTKSALKKKKISEMSNAELKSLNERLNLEKNYKDLTKTEKTAGQKFVNNVLTSAGKTVATAFVAKAMTSATNAALKKVLK